MWTTLYIYTVSFLGFITTYCFCQISILVFIFILFLFWSVAYPFSYRRLKILGMHRRAHIISVILALTLPLLPSLVHLKYGYFLPTTPPHICFGRNKTINFYMIILPQSIILGISTCLLVVIFWTIFKVLILFFCLVELQ